MPRAKKPVAEEPRTQSKATPQPELNDAWATPARQEEPPTDNWGSTLRMKLRDIEDTVVRITGMYPMVTKFGETNILAFEDGEGLGHEAWCSAGVVVRKVHERADKGRLPLDGVICKKQGNENEYWDIRMPQNGDPWFTGDIPF